MAVLGYVTIQCEVVQSPLAVPNSGNSHQTIFGEVTGMPVCVDA